MSPDRNVRKKHITKVNSDYIGLRPELFVYIETPMVIFGIIILTERQRAWFNGHRAGFKWIFEIVL